MIDPGEGAVIRIEPRTGDRIELSGKHNGDGPQFSTARTIARIGDTAFAVFDIGLNSVFRVDKESGDRSIVSSPTVGQGPHFVDPFGMVAASTDRLFVLDRGLRAILSVDLGTGDRKIVSGPERGQGPGFQSPTRLLLAPGRPSASCRRGPQVHCVCRSLQRRPDRRLRRGDRSRSRLGHARRLGACRGEAVCPGPRPARHPRGRSRQGRPD